MKDEDDYENKMNDLNQISIFDKQNLFKDSKKK